LNAPSAGFLELRQAIAKKLKKEDGMDVNPDSEILITHGAMHALSLVFTTFLDAGDEVLLYRPSFFFFGPIKLAGGQPIYASTFGERNWQWEAGELERAISARTKMIVINSPTNPTGYVAKKEDLTAIVEIARRRDLLVVSDECYDNMIYDGHRHIRLASFIESRERTITVCSFTKTFALQPWRIGFVAGPSHLIPHIQKMLEWNVLRCSHVAQRAAQAALEGPQQWVKEIARRFQRSRDLMIDRLSSARGISFVLPKGTPFLFLDVSQLGISGSEFSRTLLNDYGVLTEPGSFFGSDSHVRLRFGGPDEQIIEVATRISEASQKYQDTGPPQEVSP
jgi:aminotransferase